MVLCFTSDKSYIKHFSRDKYFPIVFVFSCRFSKSHEELKQHSSEAQEKLKSKVRKIENIVEKRRIPLLFHNIFFTGNHMLFCSI